MTPSAVATFVVGLVLGWLIHLAWTRRASAREVYAALAGRSGGPVVNWSRGWQKALDENGFPLMLFVGACLFVATVSGLGYFLLIERHEALAGWVCLFASPVGWFAGCALHVALLGMEAR